MDMGRTCSSNGIAASLAGVEILEKKKVQAQQQQQFPVGYRFRPTDEELLLHYLKPKIFSLPLPAASDVVPVCDVFLTHPSLLPGDLMEKRYFFSSRRDVHSSSRYLSCINANSERSWRRRGVVHVHVVGTSSSTGGGRGSGGYWKVNNGKDKVILASSNQLQHEQQQAVGLRRSMVFYQGKPADPHAMVKTPWIMHQFHLLATYYSPQQCRTSVMGMGDWVVCRIFQKKKNSKAEKSSRGTFKKQKGSDHHHHDDQHYNSVRCGGGGGCASNVEMLPSVVDLIIEKDEGTSRSRTGIAMRRCASHPPPPPQDCSSSSEITAGISCSNQVLDDQGEEACSGRRRTGGLVSAL